MTDLESRTYHVDGELVPAASATVHVDDRGVTHGDAAAETLRVYGGDPFRWTAHAERLAGTCGTLGLDHGLDDAELRARIDETLGANDLVDAAVTLSITRGRPRDRAGPPLDIDPDPDTSPTVVVTVAPLPRGGVGSDPVYDGPAVLQTTKTRRVPDRAIPADALTHSRLNGVLARLELRVTGADEALLRDADGAVTGGAVSTLFFADGDALRTPSLDGPVRPGVVRRTVIGIAESEGIPVEAGTYTPDEVRGADEAFLTNATWGIRPVATVDGIDFDEDETDGDGDEIDIDGGGTDIDGDDDGTGGDGEAVAGPLTTLLSRLFDRRVEERYYDGERL